MGEEDEGNQKENKLCIMFLGSNAVDYSSLDWWKISGNTGRIVKNCPVVHRIGGC